MEAAYSAYLIEKLCAVLRTQKATWNSQRNNFNPGLYLEVCPTKNAPVVTAYYTDGTTAPSLIVLRSLGFSAFIENVHALEICLCQEKNK
jgi:hypothetical protein